MNEPTKTSLKKIIREHLEQGNQLTVLSCFKLCCTNELRHFVSELKNEGMEIKSHWTTNTEGNKHFKVYYL